MGPYCRYCDQRCFVPDPAGGPIILATCAAGMAHDLKSAGYDLDLARIYVATREAVDALVVAEAPSTERRATAADFAALAASLRLSSGGGMDERGFDHSDRRAAENLAQLLAAAVLRAALAEQERARHVEEIARLRAEADTTQARHEYTTSRLRRRIHHGRRSRAALRASITRTENAS